MSTLQVTNISNLSGGNSIPVDNIFNGVAKAWVNFNGTGTVAIRASFNVTSITDNGVGDYTVNFTNALVDVNYSPVVSCGGGSSIYLVPYDQNPAFTARNTTSYRFNTLYSTNNIGGGALADSVAVYVSVFR